MAGKGNSWSNSLLALLFNGTTATGIAINATTSALTVLWVSLHTADPGAAGSQTTSETTYGAYARVSTNRATTGWTVTTASVAPAAAITFAAATGTVTNTVSYFAIGTASTGAGELLYSGTVTPNIIVSSGVTPQLLTATTVTES